MKLEITPSLALLFRLLTQDLILRSERKSGNELLSWPQELEKAGEKKDKVGLENMEAFRANQRSRLEGT